MWNNEYEESNQTPLTGLGQKTKMCNARVCACFHNYNSGASRPTFIIQFLFKSISTLSCQKAMAFCWIKINFFNYANEDRNKVYKR